jgi:hypothetical protein
MLAAVQISQARFGPQGIRSNAVFDYALSDIQSITSLIQLSWPRFSGIQNREFTAHGICHLRPKCECGFWAASAKVACSSREAA